MAYQMATSPEYWWVKAVGGIAAILFGLAAIFWPGLTLFALVLLYGAYALVEGAVEIVAMVRAIGAGGVWWTHLVLGLLSIVAGIVVLVWPGISAIVLLYVIAIWAIVLGIAEIVASFSTGQFLLAIAGVVSILFGLLLFSNPVAGALGFVIVIGVFAIVRGILLLVGAVTAPTAARPS